MKIPAHNFTSIIQQVLKEQDFSLMTDQRKSELTKKLLLYVEYVAKYYAVVKRHIDSVHGKLPPIEVQKSIADFLKTLLANPEFIQLNETIKGLIQKNIPEYQRVLPILTNALNLFVRYANSFATPVKDAKGNDISVDQIYASFFKDFNNYFASVTSILSKIRTKFSDTSTSNVDPDAKTPTLEIASLVGDLEKIINLYLSEIERVFRKFDSIRIESGEYSKKWEDYNLLRGYNFHQKAIAIETNPEFEKFSPEVKKKVADYFKNRPPSTVATLPTTTNYKFQVPIFIELLLTGKYKTRKDIKTNRDLFPNETYPTKETQKAESIDASLKNIWGWSPASSGGNKQGEVNPKSYEGMIGATLKSLHAKAWDQTTQRYVNEDELKQLMQILFNVRSIYKSSLNKIVSNMERLKAGKLEDILNTNGPILDAIIKYVQFAKLNTKNVYLKLISNSGVSIDVAKYQELFSKQEDPVIAKRLAYWALFQRLGWTKGLKSEEAPDWVYGAEASKPTEEDAPTAPAAPGPGTTPTRIKRKFPKVGPVRAPKGGVVQPTSTTPTP